MTVYYYEGKLYVHYKWYYVLTWNDFKDILLSNKEGYKQKQIYTL